MGAPALFTAPTALGKGEKHSLMHYGWEKKLLLAPELRSFFQVKLGNTWLTRLLWSSAYYVKI